MKRNNKQAGRRGSALVIVLGILSVMLLLAVAFATFERTERGGTTNLKNAFVARNSLATALGRVIEAVDLSFDSPAGDDPVAPWPHPWIASSGDPLFDYLQSAERPAGSGDNANVLTAGIAEYLSPAQLALVKAAKCNWAPIHGSIAASAAGGSDKVYGGTYGDIARPRGDDLIGRYAFVVLETTGLADLNMTGTGADSAAALLARKADFSCSPTNFLIPYGDAMDSSGESVEPFLSDPSGLPEERAFSSLADAIRQCDPGTFVTDPGDVADVVKSSSRRYYPADLFAGFAPSLSDLDPEGRPKIRLPTWEEFNGWNGEKVGLFMNRTLAAMTKIFARSRQESEAGTWGNVGQDELKIFQGVSGAEYKLSRAVLSSVALLDGMDCDGRPGGCENPLRSYLSNLGTCPEVSVSRLGTLSEEGLPAHVTGNALNFPCTESSVLLDLVYAYVSHIDVAQEEEGVAKVYEIEVTVKARGHCQNKTAESSIHTSYMSVECEINSDDPGWKDNLELCLNGRGADPEINWSEAEGASGSGEGDITVNDVSGSGADRFIEVEVPISFQVTCKAKPDPDNPDRYDGFYPLTAAQYYKESGEEAPPDVFLPVLVRVTIEDEKENTSARGVQKSHQRWTMQEVPAPALGDDYRIPLHPGIYHHQDESSFGGNKNGSDGDLAYGWAVCLAPAFAFDTTSLKNPGGTEHGFWIGDEAVRSSGRDPDDDRPGGDSLCPDLAKFWDSGNDEVVNFEINDRANGEIFNYVQQDWLANPDSADPDPVTGWLDQTGHVPDFRHSDSRDGGSFLSGAGNHLSELYTWIPAYGYAGPADLGMVMCGPLETLSLFKTWRNGGEGCDFHRVLDYFAPPSGENRYPDEGRTLSVGFSDGDVNWAQLSGSVRASKELFSGVRNGRVNLNAPFLVKCTKPTSNLSEANPPIRGDRSDRLNPYPIATVFNGAPLFRWASAQDDSHASYDDPRQIATLKEEDAFTLARYLCKTIENLSTNDPANVAVSRRFADDESDVFHRRAVRNLSVLGQGQRNANELLAEWILKGGWLNNGNGDNRKPENDYEREGLIRGVADGFCTRGQTFLAIIRADAYSPKFGENNSAEDGTTLATTHALVELFRDPVPARTPEGTMPSDGTRPVSFHNWYIRSFRVF